MNRIAYILILSLMCTPAYACSCWMKYLPKDHPSSPRNKDYFIFKVVSGAAELDAIKRKTGESSTYKVEVMDSGSSDRKMGERLDLIQENHQCAFGFLPIYHYKYMGNAKGKKINISSCDTSLWPYEGDQEKFNEWVNKLKVSESD